MPKHTINYNGKNIDISGELNEKVLNLAFKALGAPVAMITYPTQEELANEMKKQKGS